MQFPFSVPFIGNFDVLGFGTNAVDFLISVPEFPAFATKIELSKYTRSAGGEVATTCAGLQRLGFRTSYAGRFGSDDAGKVGISSLQDEGVDLAYAQTIEGAETQIAFILIDEGSGERTVVWKRDKRLEYTAKDAPVEAVADCRILHMTHHDTLACIELAREARKYGIPVSLDVDNVVEDIEKLLPLIDVLITGAEFPSQLTGIEDQKAAIIEIHARYGSLLVGTTRGDRGSLLFSGGQFIETGGFDVPGGCKDTTGAGDAFRAGLIAGILKEASIEEAAIMANAVAALKCREIGARTALPTWTEVRRFIK